MTEKQRATVAVSKKSMDDMRDYAYTNRIPIGDACQMAFDKFLEGVQGELLHRPKREVVSK